MAAPEFSAPAPPVPTDLAARLSSPALVVHLDRVRSNVARIVELLGGDAARWRPHVKTTKCPELWQVLTEAGVRAFKCATAREAWHLGRFLEDQGLEGDVVLAYPRLGPELARFGEVAREFASQRWSAVCEAPEAVAALDARCGVFVDVNPGMNRTGVPLEDRAAILALAEAAGERLRGLHVYDGHRHEADPAERERLVHSTYAEVAGLVRELAARDLRVEEVVIAGTPAFLAATRFAGFAGIAGLAHRLSPGTVLLHDARSEEETPELGLRPAAVVFTRVVSRPAPGVVTCDAGSKSVAAEAGDPIAVVLGHPELEALAPSEEHLPLRVLAGEGPPRGAELYLAPRHVCPTVNLAERCVLLDGGRYVGTAEIVARAHELLT